MVEVGMGDDHCVYGARGNREFIPVQQAQFFPALEQSAINQKFKVVELQQVFGTCDFTGSAQKFYPDLHERKKLR
jgi:hypothetical protein